jgi:hypothetical protein
MTAEAHARELAKRHELLDREIKSLSVKPSVTTVELYQLKRQKLHLKEQLAHLSSQFTRHAAE